MPLVKLNWNPNRRQLWQFGFIGGAALPLLGWLWSASLLTIAGLGVLGAGLAGLAWIRPAAMRPLFLGLSLVTLPIGLVLGELILLLVYVGVLVPLGLLYRIFRGDRLQRQWDPTANSYWRTKSQAKSVASYYRQS